MFLRIYTGIVSAFLVAALASYLIFTQVNNIRLKHYNQKMVAGIFSLIKTGVARHEGQKREQWLAIVSRISGMDWRRVEPNSLHLSPAQWLTLPQQALIFRPASTGEGFEAIARIPADDKLLLTQIYFIEEQQLRAPALLLLNELGLVPKDKRSQRLRELKEAFDFDIAINRSEKLHLDSAQRKRLSNGDVVVSWNSNVTGNQRLMVYANYDEGILTLGPIPRFNESPIELLLGILIFCLLLMAGVAYTLVFRLEKRLLNMMSVVKAWGPDALNRQVDTQGNDTISELGMSFNEMSERIAGLLSEQKHMLQAVSHDLRTPISRLKFRISEFDGHSDTVQGVHRDIDELNRLVDEILYYHKIDPKASKSNRPDFNLATLSIEHYFSELTEKLGTIFPNKQLFFEGNFDLEINVHFRYFERLLQNLATNSLGHAHKRVVLRFERNDGVNLLHVDDDGDGLAKEYWQTIFDPFMRVDQSRNKTKGGHGLGLAIVKRIAEMHDGTVSVSDSPLGGARFTVIWPHYDRI